MEVRLSACVPCAQPRLTPTGDLCRKNGVEGYPQMNLYRDGKYLETFRQSRDFDILTKYIAAHAEPRNPPAPEPPAEEPPTTATDDDALLDEVVHREDANPDGVVISLDEKNFQQTVDKGHIFVKFFAPWYVLSPPPPPPAGGHVIMPNSLLLQVWTLQEARADLETAGAHHAKQAEHCGGRL